MNRRGQELPHLAFVVANHVLENFQDSQHWQNPGERGSVNYHLFMLSKGSGNTGNNGVEEQALSCIIKHEV